MSRYRTFAVVASFLVELCMFAVPTEATEDRGYLGVVLKPAGKGGAVITHVDPGSPAELLGLKAGYVILGIGPDVIKNSNEASRAIGDVLEGEWENIYYAVGATLHSDLFTVGSRAAFDRGESFILPPRGMLGVSIANAKGIMGVRVNGVFQGSVAERAGIDVGDIIVGIQGRKVEEADDLMRLIAGRANRPTEVALVRRGQFIVGRVVPDAVSQRGALERKPGSAVAAKSDNGSAQEESIWCARTALHAAFCIGAGVVIASSLLDRLKDSSAREQLDDERLDDARKKDRAGGKAMGEDPIDSSKRLRDALE